METVTISKREPAARLTWFSILLMTAALMTMASAARADIYFWQDDEGVIHFSNQDVPPQAGLYMREPAPSPPAVVGEENSGTQDRTGFEAEAVRRQMRTERKLEEANRKLNTALDKVAELTDKAEQSQARADAAAEKARLAAIEAEQQAAAVADEHETDHRFFVYTAPYGHHYQKRGAHYRKPYYIKQNRKLIPKKHPRPSKTTKPNHLNANRRHSRSGALPLLPPERNYIPSAYGIRVRSHIPSAYGFR